MLSAALIVFSLARPAGTLRGPVSARVPTAAATAAVSDADLQQRVQAAVDKVVAEQETRLQKAFDQRVADLERHNQALLLSADSDWKFMQREQLALMRSSYSLPRTNLGEPK